MLHLIAETQHTGLVGPLIVGVGLALLSRLLFKPKQPSQVVRDDKPNTAHLRGSFIPLVIGTRKVGAIICDIWGRETAIEEEEVGGKGDFGEAKIMKTVYYEKAIHALCVGPAGRIIGIYKDGKILPESTNLSPTNSPSGSAVVFQDFGTARIYWGSAGQGVDSEVVERLGIFTSLPYICYIVWSPARLGGTPRWPILEYVISVPGDMTEGPIEYPIVDGGVNPAQAWWQIATAKFPHGAGTPTDWWDEQSIIDLGNLAQSESIGMDILVQDGEGADQVMSDIMQDFGFMVPECNGVLSPFAIRRIGAEVQELSGDLLLPPIEEIETVYLNPLGNALVYEYNDHAQRFHTATIDVDDDTTAGIRNQRRTKKIPLRTITRRDIASRVVSRRQIEDLSEPVRIKAKGLRGLRRVRPGEPFNLPGVGRVRLLSYKLSFDEPEVSLDLLRDPFHSEAIVFDDPDLPGIGEGEGNLEPHIRFEMFELPYALTGGSDNSIVVLHHRANSSIFGSVVWASTDGLTYENLGSQNSPATGGLLTNDWCPASTPSVIVEYGPLITIDENGDELTVPQNLSGSYESWTKGNQILVMRDELLYVREFVEVDAATKKWQARGCIRCRSNTGKLIRSTANRHNFPRHVADEPAFLIPISHVSLLTSPTVQAGSVQLTKSQPVNNQGSLPLAAVQPHIEAQRGLGKKAPTLPWFITGSTLGHFFEWQGAWANATLYNEDDAVEHNDATYICISPHTSSSAVEPGVGDFWESVWVRTRLHTRFDGRWMYDNDDDSHVTLSFIKPAKSGGAGTMGAGVATNIEEWPDSQCAIRIEIRWSFTASTFEDLDALSDDNPLMSLVIWDIPLDGSDPDFIVQKEEGVYTIFIARSKLADEVFEDLGGGFFPLTDETSLQTGVLPWEWTIYFDNGTRSEPMYARPRDEGYPNRAQSRIHGYIGDFA